MEVGTSDKPPFEDNYVKALHYHSENAFDYAVQTMPKIEGETYEELTSGHNIYLLNLLTIMLTKFAHTIISKEGRRDFIVNLAKQVHRNLEANDSCKEAAKEWLKDAK